MGLTVKDNGGGDFELIPAATYIATSYALIDLGTHDYEYKGDVGTHQKVYIGWELNDTDTNGKPYTIGKYYTASLGSKATLRKDLIAWRGRDFTESELSEFHLQNILGKSCSLGVIHKKSGEYDRARISSIQALPKGTPPYAAVNHSITFDMDNFDPELYTKLPKFLKEMIKESHEYKALVDAGFVEAEDEEAPPSKFSNEDLLTEDDIPF
jgi:hypothetical protein